MALHIGSNIMDKNINYPPETKLIIDEYEEIRTDIRDAHKYTDIDPDVFKASDIKVLSFMECFESENQRAPRFQYHVECGTDYNEE